MLTQLNDAFRFDRRHTASAEEYQTFRLNGRTHARNKLLHLDRELQDFKAEHATHAIHASWFEHLVPKIRLNRLTEHLIREEARVVSMRNHVGNEHEADMTYILHARDPGVYTSDGNIHRKDLPRVFVQGVERLQL